MSFKISFTPTGSVTEPTLIEAITTVGITSGLQFALDAGDSNSYSGSGQKWLDTSGNGQDFFLGADINVDVVDDPTFNGIAGGKSSSEFWTFEGDGAVPLFTYDSAPETWMSGLNLDGTTFTMVSVTFDNAFQSMFKSFNLAGDNSSFSTLELSSGRPSYVVQDGAGGFAFGADADTVFTGNDWNFHTLTIDENGGNVSFYTLNGAFNQVDASNTFDASYTSPDGIIDTFILGEAIAPLSNRQAMYAFWNTAISKANLDLLFEEVRGRFGL